jgi:predicted RNase H-like HicB family nuclease
MNKYEIFIYWRDEVKSCIADVQELPGCMTDGKTYKEALKKC